MHTPPIKTLEPYSRVLNCLVEKVIIFIKCLKFLDIRSALWLKKDRLHE